MNSTHPLAKRKTRGKRVHEFHPPFGQEESKSGKVASIPPTLAPRGKLTHTKKDISIHKLSPVHQRTRSFINSTHPWPRVKQGEKSFINSSYPWPRGKQGEKSFISSTHTCAKRKARGKHSASIPPALWPRVKQEEKRCINSTHPFAKRKASREKKLHQFHPTFVKRDTFCVKKKLHQFHPPLPKSKARRKKAASIPATLWPA